MEITYESSLVIMKSTLVLPIGLILTGIIISGIVYTYDISPFSDSTNNDKTNLTAEEAIGLAVHDLSVSEFVRQTQTYAEAEHDKGIWTVRFTEIYNENYFVEVEIDDKTELILNSEKTGDSANLAQDQQFNSEANYYSPENGVSSQDDSMVASNSRGGLIEDYYYYNNPELIEAAIDYFTNLDIVANFLTENELEFYGYSYNDEVYLWGYDNQAYEIWMSSTLSVQEIDESNWIFDLLEISSTSLFGDAIHDFTEIYDLLKVTDEFIEFADKVENYTSYDVLNYHNDNNQDQYIFNMRYSPTYYFYDDIVYDVDGAVSSSDATISVEPSQTDEERATDICYCFYNEWIEFEISDQDVTIENVWGPDTALLSSNEALSLVLANSEIQSWMGEINYYHNYTYYDGYGNWWISLYDTEDYYNYANARLNDRTEVIDEIYTILSVPATMTEIELHNAISALRSPQRFFDAADDYDKYFYYDHYGVWYFSYYDKNNYYNYMWGSISDEDGTILELQVKVYHEPELTDQNIVNILEANGLVEFKNLYPDVSFSIYYNGYDTWYVYGYSMILIEAWFWAQIEDSTGEITEYTENHPTNLPGLTVNEVLTIAYTVDEYTEIKGQTDISYEYYYYYNGYWHFYLQGTDDNKFYWLSITINDDTSEVEEIWSSSWEYNTHAYADPDYVAKYGDVTEEASG